MKTNKIKLYAKALSDVIAKRKVDEKKIIKNFIKFLISSGYTKKTNQILDLAEEMLLKKQGKRKIIFETARSLTPKTRAFLEEFVKEGDVVKEKINQDLVAGIKITVNNEKQFDNSILNKINNIYKSL